MFIGAHRTQRISSALTLLERNHKNGDEFFSHIVTGDETLVSFVNVETKKLANQCMHTYSPNMQKILNKRLPESWWKLFSGTREDC
jgi:hypothetical protein